MRVVSRFSSKSQCKCPNFTIQTVLWFKISILHHVTGIGLQIYVVNSDHTCDESSWLNGLIKLNSTVEQQWWSSGTANSKTWTFFLGSTSLFLSERIMGFMQLFNSPGWWFANVVKTYTLERKHTLVRSDPAVWRCANVPSIDGVPCSTNAEEYSPLSKRIFRGVIWLGCQLTVYLHSYIWMSVCSVRGRWRLVTYILVSSPIKRWVMYSV